MIGIFDSGLGGLTVWKETVRLLPASPVVYVSDNAYCPYGLQSAGTIIDRCQKITSFLIRKGSQLIVVACNTATAVAIDTLRAGFKTPFVGMEPAVKPAALHSRSGVVGVLATQGTLGGRLYQDTIQRFATHVRVMEQVGAGLVELIEEGLADAPQTLQLLRTYIEPMIEAGADHLVLGCTHYPFLMPVIEQIVQGRMTIVDPAPAVAQQVYALWRYAGHPLQEDTVPVYRFYATGSDEALRACCSRVVSGSASTQFYAHFDIS